MPTLSGSAMGIGTGVRERGRRRQGGEHRDSDGEEADSMLQVHSIPLCLGVDVQAIHSATFDPTVYTAKLM